MKCTVCKVSKEKGEGRGRWVFSSERVPMAKVQILFKLYELTKKEFTAGSICPLCFDLVAQIDSLEFQVCEATKNLKSRINCCSDPEEYVATHANDEDFYEVDDDLDELEPKAEVRSRGAKKGVGGRKRLSKDTYLRTRVKREKPDYDEYHEEDLLDRHDEDDEEADDMDMSSYLSVETIKKEKEEAGLIDHERKPTSRIQPNRSQENLDFNLTVTRTTRGHDQLVYDNYTYLKTTHQPAGDIARWKCTSYYASKTGCKAKLHTTLDGLCVLLDSKTDHNHPPPDERKLKIILFREQVKQIASNHPEMKPTEILTNAQMLLDTPTSLGLKDESIMRYIQRIKSKHKSGKQQPQTGQTGSQPVLKPEQVQPGSTTVQPSPNVQTV